MTFAIYAQPEGQAEPLWSETHPAVPGVPIKNGQINVLLGQITSLDDPAANGSKPAVSFDQAPRYLGITIGSGPGAQEMVPRHQLVPAFHARTADLASAVIANGVDANAIRANAITASKLGTDAVTAEKVQAGAIGSDELAPNAVVGSKIAQAAVGAGQIAENSVSEAKLTPELRQRLGGIIAPLQIYADLDTQTPRSLAKSGGNHIPAQSANLSLAMRRGSASLPCASGVPPGAAGPDPCGDADGTVGLVFGIPRSGDYEVCMQFPASILLEVGTTATVEQGVIWSLDETGLTTVAPIQAGDAFPQTVRIQTGASTQSHTDQDVMSLCQFFTFASATEQKAVRLRYRWDGPTVISQGGVCPGCAIIIGRSISIKVRELL